MKRTRSKLSIVPVLAMVLALVPLTSVFAASPTGVFISELHYDNAGSDAGEFFEVTGDKGVDLTGWSVVLYNGNGGGSYATIDITSTIPDEDGSQGAIAFFHAGIQNGSPDGLALVDDGGAVIEFLSYEGSFMATDGPAIGLTSADIGVSESSSTPIGESLQVLSSMWTGPAAESPGLLNIDVPSDPFGVCLDGEELGIHEIQGSGFSSPYTGSIRVVEGTVVGDFTDTSVELGAFFIQEEDQDIDSDPTTSEGLYVANDGFGSVAVGDTVRVRGFIKENFGQTEMQSVTDLEVCDPSKVPSTATASEVLLPLSSVGDWEYVEGMLVNLTQTLHVSGNFNQGRYGEVDLSVGSPLDNPTNVVSPGAAANALQDLNDRSRIQLDDGSNVQNPEPLPPYIGDGNTLRTGDTTPGLTGVVGYGFGWYEIHPTTTVTFTRVNDRPATPPAIDSRLKVASFNVLNYFTTIDSGDNICGPSGDLGCRGADSELEFQRQRDKIIDAIVKMDADVIGLMEIENPTDVPLDDLVDGLNNVAGNNTYREISTGAIGDDAIAVAFIYKRASVTPVAQPAILDSTVDPTFNDEKNRPALAQTFLEKMTGSKITVVVNHFKSKGSSCSSIGDPDTGDGQGNCNSTRTDAATALANWLATDPTGSNDPDFLVIGDLNSYAMEDPIEALNTGGYSNLVEAFVGSGWQDSAYSFNFFSQSGYLDHALANDALLSQVVGTTFWHINADEPSALDYNTYNQAALYQPDQYRASDHDAVIVGLDLYKAPPKPHKKRN